MEKIKTKKYRFTLKIIMLDMRIIPLVIFTPYRIYYQEITVYKKLDIVKQYMFFNVMFVIRLDQTSFPLTCDKQSMVICQISRDKN